MALGVSYWLYNALMLSTSAISYARMAQLDAQGRLAEMVTESLPLETLQTYASDLNTLGISSFYIQMLGVLVLMFMSAALTLFLFLAVKRKDKRYLFITMGAHFVLLMILNLCLRFFGNIGYVIANFLVLGAAIFTLMQFMKWYRAQQAALLERKREYRERLKEMGGTN